MTGAVKVSKCGKIEEDDSSVKRPEVCNTLRGEVLLRTRGEGELVERKSGDFRRRRRGKQHVAHSALAGDWRLATNT